MSFKMRIAGFTTLMVAMTAFTLEAQAQYGYGMAGAMPACPYPYAAAPGATSANDGIKEAQEAIKEAKRKLSQKKSEKKRMDRDVEKAEKDITDVVESGYAEFVIQHMQNARTCAEYFPDDGVAGPDSGDFIADGREDGKPIPRRPVGRHGKKAPPKTAPFTAEEWSSVCVGRGGVSSEVCTEYRGSGSRTSSSICAKALPVYRKKYAEAQKLQDEIDNLEHNMERLNDDLKDARQAAIDERKAATEGGICIECMQKAQGYTYQQQQPNYLSLALGVGMGLAGMYAGYQTNKTVAQYNSNIGYQTQPTPLLGYGFPYFAAGLYGGLGGGIGQGGFGCGGSFGGGGFGNGPYGMQGPFGMGGGLYGQAGMNSPFGYPGMGMGGMPGLGGGMYMPGMSPWGMNGPGGLGMGGFNPYAMGGMGMGMNPYGMGGMGMMNPYGMGGMGMNPFGMGGLGAGGIGAGFGMNPYGMGGMGMPGMGMMGMPGMLGGGLGMGMPGMGMNPYGIGGMGGMGMMDPSSMMMQQQMQQLQMQQYQQYMASQQAAMQDAMNRQRTVAGLQSELYGLMNRIQQAQMGIGVGSTGSYLGTNGYNSGTYSGSGSITGGISGAGYLAPYSTGYPYTTTPGTTAITPLGTGR